MIPKLIIVPFNGHDHKLSIIEYAFNLAILYNAHTEIWYITPGLQTAFIPYAPYGMPAYSEHTLATLKKRQKNNMKMAEKKFQHLKKTMGIEKATFHTASGNESHLLAIRGRVADLTLLYRDKKNPDFMSQAHDVLFGSGHPVLFLPPENKIKKFNGKILIAWNGSVEATHSVAFSLPWLLQGKVSILAKQDNGEQKYPLSAKDLAHYLEHHNIETNILPDTSKQEDLATFILSSAKKIDAEIIVMGAYGHSRFRENIFGGVTRSMLESADMPVFMMH